MSKTPKYSLGQTVVNLVSKKGSYEPSMCGKYEKMTVDKVEVSGNTYAYTCGYDGYDGYRFSEHELVSLEEYKSQLCVKF